MSGSTGMIKSIVTDSDPPLGSDKAERRTFLWILVDSAPSMMAAANSNNLKKWGSFIASYVRDPLLTALACGLLLPQVCKKCTQFKYFWISPWDKKGLAELRSFSCRVFYSIKVLL